MAVKTKKDYYETLGVDRKASPEAVKRAYRAKAKQSHPDAGGSPEEFKQIAKAYETLSDEKSREHYDRTGEELPPQGIVKETLASLLPMAFMQQHPGRWLCHKLSTLREEANQAVRQCEQGLETCRSNLLAFQVRNMKTKNKEGLEFISVALEAELAKAEAQMAKTKYMAGVYTECLEMINDLWQREGTRAW